MLLRLFNQAVDDGPAISQFQAPSPPAAGDVIAVANATWRVAKSTWHVQEDRLYFIDLTVCLVEAPDRAVWEGTEMEIHIPPKCDV